MSAQEIIEGQLKKENGQIINGFYQYVSPNSRKIGGDGRNCDTVLNCAALLEKLKVAPGMVILKFFDLIGRQEHAILAKCRKSSRSNGLRLHFGITLLREYRENFPHNIYEELLEGRDALPRPHVGDVAHIFIMGIFNLGEHIKPGDIDDDIDDAEATGVDSEAEAILDNLEEFVATQRSRLRK